MKNKLMLTSVLSLLVLASGVGCERAASELSQVSLQLPTYKSETAFACTKCLKAVIVNVDNESFNTIIFHSKSAIMGEPGTELSSEVNLDVPSGLGRKIQILAVYLKTDSTFEVQYGSAVVDLLTTEPPPVLIPLTNLGPFKGGSIVGRFMTAPNSGPTGNIIISMNHAASGMNMDIAEAEMLDGWFDFFASENFSMSYRFELGLALPGFQNVTLDSFMPLVGGTAAPNIARVHRPSSYRSGLIQINESHDIVYGFFGDGAALKKVCFEDNPLVPMNFTNLTTNGVTLLTYDESDSTASIYGISGLNSTSHSVLCDNSVTADRYRNDVISINMKQFDGYGNDTTKSIGGAFTYQINSSNSVKYKALGTAPRVFTFKGLPNIFGTLRMFDGVKVFMKTGAINGGFGSVKCNPVWMAVAGFSEASNFAPAFPDIVGDVVKVAFSPDPVSSDGYIICPTKGGIMTGKGGLYVGVLQ